MVEKKKVVKKKVVKKDDVKEKTEKEVKEDLEGFSDEELELIDYFLLNLSDICYKIDTNEKK